ncbi:MAG: hypothetical protein ACJ71Y_07115 [Blastococcus sp.]
MVELAAHRDAGSERGLHVADLEPTEVEDARAMMNTGAWSWEPTNRTRHPPIRVADETRTPMSATSASCSWADVLVEQHSDHQCERVAAEQFVGRRVLGDAEYRRPRDPASSTRVELRRLRAPGRRRLFE